MKNVDTLKRSNFFEDLKSLKTTVFEGFWDPPKRGEKGRFLKIAQNYDRAHIGEKSQKTLFWGVRKGGTHGFSGFSVSHLLEGRFRAILGHFGPF